MPIQITKRPYLRSFSGNPVHYELTSAVAATDPDIYFEIRLMFRYFSGAFYEVHRWQHYPTTGIAEISVHDLLHSQLEWYLPKVLPDEKESQWASIQTGEFFIEFREILPSADQNPSWDNSEQDFLRTVIRGGINYFEWRGNNFWINYFNPSKPFLTWQLNGRLASLNERMYLGYLCSHEGLTDVRARCKVTYYDASTATVEHPINAPALDCLYYVPAGATQWGLPALDPSKSIHYWEIYIVDLSAPDSPVALSEIFKYERDQRWDLNDVTLHYRSSLGCLDSVAVRGVLELTLDYSFQEQNRTFSPDYYDGQVITAQRLITENREQVTWKGNLGHLRREEQDRLRDLQMVRDAYMYGRGKWFPINIITRNFKLRATNDMRFAMPIEFTLGYDGADYYTPKSVDLGDGVFTANVCLASLDLDLLVEYDAPGTPAGHCLVTINGNEIDPQNASVKFRYQVEGGPWREVFFSNLPAAFHWPINQTPVLSYQAICTGDLPGKRHDLQFTTFEEEPLPPVFPIQIVQVSSTGMPGSTRSQVFEFNGWGINAVLPANVKLICTVYGVSVQVLSTGTETLNQLLDTLVGAINTTPESFWQSAGSAPVSGTPGFPPTATHAAGSNRITLVLNYQNLFNVTGQWG